MPHSKESNASSEKELSRWDYETGVTNLVRDRNNGRYYARVQIDGKRSMKALKTTEWKIAKTRVIAKLSDADRSRNKKNRVTAVGDVRMKDLFVALDAYYEDPEIAKKTRASYYTAKVLLAEQWQKLFHRDLMLQRPETITTDLVVKFSFFLSTNAVRRLGHNHNGEETTRTGYGSTTINKAIGALHRAMRFAVSNGLILDVPFEPRPIDGRSVKRPVPVRHLVLPSRKLMDEIFAQMRDSDGLLPQHSEGRDALQKYITQRAEHSADFAEFIAYSGARKTEASNWVWEDDQGDVIYLRGTKSAASKNRVVPKIPALRKHLLRMRERYRELAGKEPKGKAFYIGQCAIALASACERAGAGRLTHHDLRHYFATVAIESGVDIPTISRWLGHGDGGSLAMKTYGHLRQEHSIAAAARVI